MMENRSSSVSTLFAALAFAYAVTSFFLLPFLCPLFAFIPDSFFLRSSAQIKELSERGISTLPYYIILGVTITGLITLFGFAIRRANQKLDYGYFAVVLILSILTYGRLSSAISGI
jgi:hypothetical protein